jgi:hypothetical protein
MDFDFNGQPICFGDIQPKPKDPIDEPFDNSVPKEAFPPIPSETSTRHPVPAPTQWPPHVVVTDAEDDGNSLGNDVSIMGQKQVTPASFFARPGILAGIAFIYCTQPFMTQQFEIAITH